MAARQAVILSELGEIKNFSELYNSSPPLGFLINCLFFSQQICLILFDFRF